MRFNSLNQHLVIFLDHWTWMLLQVLKGHQYFQSWQRVHRCNLLLWYFHQTNGSHHDETTGELSLAWRLYGMKKAFNFQEFYFREEELIDCSLHSGSQPMRWIPRSEVRVCWRFWIFEAGFSNLFEDSDIFRFSFSVFALKWWSIPRLTRF